MSKTMRFFVVVICSLLVFAGCSSDDSDGKDGKAASGKAEDGRVAGDEISYIDYTCDTNNFTVKVPEVFGEVDKTTDPLQEGFYGDEPDSATFYQWMPPSGDALLEVTVTGPGTGEDLDPGIAAELLQQYATIKGGDHLLGVEQVEFAGNPAFEVTYQMPFEGTMYDSKTVVFIANNKLYEVTAVAQDMDSVYGDGAKGFMDSFTMF